MKTGSIHTNNLSNDNHFQFMTQIRNLILGIGAEKLKIQKQFTVFQANYEKADEALLKINKSALTEQLQILDGNRDDSCIGIVEYNKSMLRHYDSVKSSAAKRLKIVFDTYGNITNKPLQAQTASVYNLVQELQGKFFGDIKTIGLDEWVAKLDEQNKDFEKLMTERFKESTEKSNIVLRDVRKELDGVYKNICSIINALVLMDDTDNNYEEFIKMQNEIVKKYGGKKNKTTPSGDDGKQVASPTDDGDNTEIKLWDANEDYTKMKIGDKRQTADGRIWEAIDLGQVHRDPTGPDGHFGWKEVITTESEDEVTYCEEG